MAEGLPSGLDDHAAVLLTEMLAALMDKYLTDQSIAPSGRPDFASQSV